MHIHDLKELRFIFEVPAAKSGISEIEWEEEINQAVRVWKEANSTIGRRKYILKDQEFLIEANWSPMARSYIKYNKMMDIIMKKDDSDRDTIEFSRVVLSWIQSRVRIPIRVFVSGSYDPDTLIEQSLCIVENYLHDVFIIMNISNPGLCEFYRSQIREVDRLKPRVLGVSDLECSLSGYHFESSDVRRKKGEWPSSIRVDTEKLAKWVWSHRSGYSQIPDNKIEAVLFALLHLAKEEELSATSVVWLFYALETLYDTQPGQNRRALINRAKMLIECDQQRERTFKKSFDLLYDIRSSIIHGGMKITHPLRDPSLDERVEDQYYRLMDTVDFGFSLLIYSIQCTILNNWNYPRFIENVCGDQVTTSPE